MDAADNAAAAPARAETPAPPQLRDLSPRWLRFCKFLLVCLSAPGAGLGMILLLAIASHRGFNFGYAVLLVLIPGVVLAVAVHEGGHWLAARWRGMTVQTVMMLFCELQPRRRGVRARLAPLGGGLKGAGGFVLAFPAPGRGQRSDWTWVYVGGAAANLAVAAAFALAAWDAGRSFAQVVWSLLALLQLAIALNLIPLRLAGVASDGLNVVRLWRNRVQDLPGAAFWDMNSHLLHGGLAGDLPPGLRERLAAEPAPMPLFCDWLDVWVALERDDLEQAQAALERLRGRDDAQAFADLLAFAQVELMFRRALRQPDAQAAAQIEALDWHGQSFWYSPQIPSRLGALAAAIRGDGERMETLLRRSQRYADNDPMPVRRAHERGARESVRALLAARGSAVQTQEAI